MGRINNRGRLTGDVEGRDFDGDSHSYRGKLSETQLYVLKWMTGNAKEIPERGRECAQKYPFDAYDPRDKRPKTEKTPIQVKATPLPFDFSYLAENKTHDASGTIQCQRMALLFHENPEALLDRLNNPLEYKHHDTDHVPHTTVGVLVLLAIFVVFMVGTELQKEVYKLF